MLLGAAFLTACAPMKQIGQPPAMSLPLESAEMVAMSSPGLPRSLDPNRAVDGASLWSGGRGSLLGNRRAETRGDILTVVIEIDDRAEFQSSSERSRSGSETMSMGGLFGIPQRLDPLLPAGATMSDAVGLSSASTAAGDGSVSRNERLELRVAATVTDMLPNGSLAIEGRQELRVNYELRELVVSGYVRPEDISRQNEVSYDKIAAARISYGGRGQIDRMQQPRYGQRLVDAILPF